MEKNLDGTCNYRVETPKVRLVETTSSRQKISSLFSPFLLCMKLVYYIHYTTMYLKLSFSDPCMYHRKDLEEVPMLTIE